MGIRVRVEGLENIPPGACVFISNHVSNADALAFTPAIPRRVAILIKQELFRIPIFPPECAGHSLFRWTDPTGKRRQRALTLPFERSKKACPLPYSRKELAARMGTCAHFKRGAFTIAIQAGAPIVPVSISGTLALMKKGDWIIRPGEAVVRFGPAVDSSTYTMDRRGELLARVQAIVAASLPPEQQPDRSFAARYSGDALLALAGILLCDGWETNPRSNSRGHVAVQLLDSGRSCDRRSHRRGPRRRSRAHPRRSFGGTA